MELYLIIGRLCIRSSNVYSVNYNNLYGFGGFDCRAEAIRSLLSGQVAWVGRSSGCGSIGMYNEPTEEVMNQLSNPESDICTTCTDHKYSILCTCVSR